MDVIICFSEYSYKKAKKERGEARYLLIFSRVSSIQEDSYTIYIPIEPIADDGLAKKYTEQAISLNNDYINASLNNSYFYCASTVVSVCEYTHNILYELSPEKVYLYGTPLADKYIPSTYTDWGESSINLWTSPECFYPYISEKISKDFNLVHKNGNILIHTKKVFSKKLRLFFVPLMCFFLSLRKLHLFPIKKKVSATSHSKIIHYFIIRTDHQLTVTKNIIASLGLNRHEVTLVELESIGSRGCIDKIQDSGYDFISPYHGMRGFCNAVTSLFESYLNIYLLNKKPSSIKAFTHKGITLNLRNMTLDSMIQPQVVLYQKQLKHLQKIFKRTKSVKVFSLEQVSPQAYFDHKILGNSANLYFIKSTLIQEIPMPCISWGKYFLVNDKKELALRDVSILNKNAIVYSGSPKYSSILNLKKKVSLKLKQVIFATQPHETEVNKRIVDQLIKIKDEIGFNLIIRKHPRDIEKYHYNSDDNIVIDSSTNIYKQLAGADLLVARTSTVLEECIYIGLPYICCLISAKDRSYSASYISSKSGLVAYDLEQLALKIDHYTDLINSFSSFRNEYLKNFKHFTLPSGSEVNHN